METRAYLEALDSKVTSVCKATLAYLAVMARKDSKVNEVPVLQDRGRKEIQALGVLVYLVAVVIMETRVLRVLLQEEDRKDSVDLTDRKGMPAGWVSLVTLGSMVALGVMVTEAKLETRVTQASPALVLLVLRASVETMVALGVLASLVPPETKVQKESLVRMAPLASLDKRVTTETQAGMVALEPMVHLDRRENQAEEELLTKDDKVSRESLEPRVSKDLMGCLETMVRLERREIGGFQAMQA